MSWEGFSHETETQTCQVVRFQVGGKLLAVVDTPGFDDTTRSDAEILDEIVQFLVFQHQLGIHLKGIIYLHRITDNKMQGTAQRYFEMFKRLCGEKNMKNVVLLTTMWDTLKDEGLGLRRDQQLRQEFWSVMESKGSFIRRFDGSGDMAEAIVCRLMRQPNVVLDIQRELVDEGKRLDETSAGQLLVPKLEERIRESTVQLQILEKNISKSGYSQHSEERRKLEQQRALVVKERELDIHRRGRLQGRPGREATKKIAENKKSVWKDTISMFSALLGLAVTVTVNVILPLAGVVAF
jgi:hypothetical protein